MTTKKIQATLLSLALLLPAGSAFAMTHQVRHRRHHYNQARGAVIGAVAGAAIDHHHPIKGAVIGAAVGEGVQIVRNHKAH